MTQAKKDSARPLESIKVLDLTGERGIFTGKALADLGAVVILVESPGGSRAGGLAPFKDD